jgi:uncharacterized protein
MRDQYYQGSCNAYDVIVEKDVMVPARDGVGLMTDIYRPALGSKVVQDQFPVILARTPYGKEGHHAEGMFFAKYGYICAFQDWRQTKGEYDYSQYRPKNEPLDGYDAVEWLASQPWSNGKVGILGHSATGMATQAILPLRPPSLVSAHIIDTGLSYGAYPTRQNGAFGQAFWLRFCLRMAVELEKDPETKKILNDAYFDPSKYFSCFEYPHRPIKKGASVLSLSPFYEYRYLKVATTPNLDDDFWKDSGKRDEELLYDWKDIPIFFLSGWYGNHLTATIEKYKTLKSIFKSPVKLLIGHWEHLMLSTFAGNVDFGVDSNVDVHWMQRLQWFDETLKGLDTGIYDGPSVQYFVMGGGSGTKNYDGRLNHGGKWSNSESWPPPHVQSVPFYLHEDGLLSIDSPQSKDSCTTYTYDPKDPVPTVGGNFMDYSSQAYERRVIWMPDGAAQDQRGNKSKQFCKDNLPLSSRDDVLVFQTPPLENDVEVSGELQANLWVSSTAPDTDFTVKLIDVYPNSHDYPEGFAMNLQDAVVRMRYRNGRIKPELIEPGKIYEVELPFHSTSNLFKKGHMIRVDISSSNFPRVDVNLNTGGPLGKPGPVRLAENTIYHDKDHPSSIILPVGKPE